MGIKLQLSQARLYTHIFLHDKHSPTTYRIPSVEAVWNIGASPETSHRYWPVVVKSTLSNTTSRSVDNLAWNNDNN